jgi:hypothetical protein
MNPGVVFDDSNRLLINRAFNFDKFGYENAAAICKKCGKKPARIEPRFGYASCIEHFHLRPVDFN